VKPTIPNLPWWWMNPIIVGHFCLDTFFPRALLLPEAPLIHCYGNLSKLLCHLKFDSSHISKLFTFHCVLIFREGLQFFNPLNAELNPICHLLALLGAHHILHISRIRVKEDLICFCALSKLEATDRWCSFCCAVSNRGMIFADMSYAEICH